MAIKEYYPLGLAASDTATNVTYVQLPHPDGTSPCVVRATEYELGELHFIKEVRALVRLNHRHVVRAYRVIEDVGRPCLVMEYIEGSTLVEELGCGPLPEARVRQVLMALSEGLQHVHEAGLLHLDIKPENIMLRTDGTPILIDFGAARQAMAWRSVDDCPVGTFRTPGYAPIEQYDDPKQQTGPWTDIYGLGALGYEALVGRKPERAPARLAGAQLPTVAVAASRVVSAELAAAIGWALVVCP